MAGTVTWIREAASYPFSRKTMVEAGQANRKDESRKLGSSVEGLDWPHCETDNAMEKGKGGKMSLKVITEASMRNPE